MKSGSGGVLGEDCEDVCGPAVGGCDWGGRVVGRTDGCGTREGVASEEVNTEVPEVSLKGREEVADVSS